MKEPAEIAIARELYRQVGTIGKTVAALKTKGYNIHASTVKRWKTEYNWEEYCTAYAERLQKYDNVVLDVEKEILLDLTSRFEKTKAALDTTPDNTQLLHAFINLTKEIMKIVEKKQVDHERIVDEVIRMFLDDPVAGKVLKSRREAILKMIKKESK